MPRVLIVDDQPAIRKVLAAALRVRGIESEQAADGESALRMLCSCTAEGGRYDAVVLDIAMPGVNGWEVLQAIRANPLWREMKVVILTGTADEVEDRVRANDLDALLVEKNAEFVRVIEQLLQRVVTA